MNKKEEFKAFAKLHPELIHYVKNGSMSWQKFYEIYDIYGASADAWQNYLTPENVGNPASEAVGVISDKIRSIDMNSIQEHIKTAQKAINLVSELTSKTESTTSAASNVPKVPRPINHFFED